MSAVACLSQDTVLRLIEGRLEEGEAGAVDDHIDGCESCRSLVVEVVRAQSGTRKRGSDRATAAAPILEPGNVLAERFEIVRLVGSGAMGVVYEAEDRELGVRVALKVLRPEAAPTLHMLHRLRQEIVLGRRITHANVCRLFDVGTATRDGEVLHFLSMELVAGQTLASVLARNKPPLDQALRILGQICTALEAAHSQGVVHRDLKPANVMVAPDGKVVVMDFGLARDLRADRSERGGIVGTPAYWAPEQARGGKATVRSDLYALGLVACELLGGPRPRWDADPPIEAVPAALRPVIERCLARLPEERFGSAREIREGLAAALRKPRSRPGSSRILLAVAVAVGAVAVAVLLATRAPHRPSRQDRVVAPSPRPDPAAEAPREVSVTIEVEPLDAAILRGNELLGTGRAQLTFPSAKAPATRLRMERTGFAPAEIEARPDGPPVLHVALDPRRGEEPGAGRARRRTSSADRDRDSYFFFE
ncbi:MAG: serine/threonine protein kinase [Deltaproteobacteria bacterium]|nr:serine/threonine protein kinase [Deltaproteobacteria bacterium]